MPFRELTDRIEHQTIDKKMRQVCFDDIVAVYAYMADFLTVDEQRIVIETVQGDEYTFSEEESGWEDFVSWLEEWACLSKDWWSKAYKEPFTKEETLLWRIST